MINMKKIKLTLILIIFCILVVPANVKAWGNISLYDDGVTISYIINGTKYNKNDNIPDQAYKDGQPLDIKVERVEISSALVRDNGIPRHLLIASTDYNVKITRK